MHIYYINCSIAISDDEYIDKTSAINFTPEQYAGVKAVTTMCADGQNNYVLLDQNEYPQYPGDRNDPNHLIITLLYQYPIFKRC